MAKLVSAQGVVQARRFDEREWHAIQYQHLLCADDIVRVMENSRAALELNNETVVRLDQNTTLVLSGLEQHASSWLEVLKGAIHVLSRVPSKSLKIKTPFVNAAIEGTEFVVAVDEEQTLVAVIEGQVAVENDKGHQVLKDGQSSITKSGEAPVLRLDIDPEDAVRWSLYYPAVLIRSASTQDKTGKSTELKYIQQAAELLSLGRVDEAIGQLDLAQKINNKSSAVTAMYSIIALTQNHKARALELAEKALMFDPQSPEAYIALSYVQQSYFDLVNAKASIEKALSFESDNNVSQNGLLWSRLAELRLSFNDVDGALQAARKAVNLDSGLARNYTVLGFVYLSQFKPHAAKQEFEHAIELDQADPLPRLGLGLALVREGDLKEGRRAIEIATTLDPNNALIRSYLGKAYYEEKRNTLAMDQFSLSKELDQMDPTPWFYAALSKQSRNRPVDALHDFKKSIQLNNNRVVYRSRLLLEQDLAARSAGLARIYSDLGFDQMALVEGWKSLNIDPGDYSAHRFLADSYARLPHHEIARVSELLQAQLLQPINLNPIQPQLSESGLGILDGAGPSDIAFNEFNPLFVRNRLAWQLNGIVGGNETYGDDFVHSGVWNNVSYSLGQFHYESDGFRENNDQDQDIYNVFFQTALSHKTSIQFEYRDVESEQGDLELKFDSLDFSTTNRKSIEHQILRFGLHQTFSPDSRLLVSAISSEMHEDQTIVVPFSTIHVSLPMDGEIIEAQYQWGNALVTVYAGVGGFRLDKSENYIDAASGLSLSYNELDIEHDNAYVYSYWDLTDKVDINVALSWDSLKYTEVKLNEINPKLGITWEASNNTIIRLAAFKTIKRDLIANQTLEPTQIAGFNQFFDDGGNATEALDKGIALDKELSNNLFGGVELSKRDLDVSALDFFTGNTIKATWSEDINRAYLYWTPNNKVATSIEYYSQKLGRPKEFAPDGFLELKTQRIPLSISLFVPSGFSINLKSTYIDQKGEFLELLPSPMPSLESSGKDSFWITDIEMAYRLPKRCGMIALGIKNIFDQPYHFQEIDSGNPQFIPERFLFTRLSLAY